MGNKQMKPVDFFTNFIIRGNTVNLAQRRIRCAFILQTGQCVFINSRRCQIQIQFFKTHLCADNCEQNTFPDSIVNILYR